ncbi:urea transport system permease protein [Bosea sp. OAE752]|uniref:Urea ABC transporter permease subunit UrtB n=1 Tax=Bosea spartocytisi TaxID=2773451 RepID=A0A927E576_9HYPH|nr:urea ABC transporter permease subunit UrtB [Bosea spartocytisi]MBD3845001.1 urea ABC transporter permease subunit UrtB [Bosea spartocytisi]MCT4471203.1 urea ABC transporter permease subunit UrtB [Bosea spartocytisi]
MRKPVLMSFLYRLLHLGVIVVALVAASIASFAQTADEAFTRLAADSYSDTTRAVEILVSTAHPNAALIVEALNDGRLLAGPGGVVLKTPTGGFVDARTGAALTAAPADVKTVRLNNAVRRTVQAALGGLSLLNPEPAKRTAAAEAVFKSRDASLLPIVEAAIGKETDPRALAALRQAQAAILIAKPDAAPLDRLGAIDLLRERGDQDALATLRSLAGEATPALKDAQARAISAIEGRLRLWAMAQNLWYGLSLGSVLLLAAIGLAITFGVMGVINMAHGEMVMLGAYTTFVVQEIIRANAPGLFDWSLAIALPAAFIVSGAVGIAIERGVIRFLYGRPLETLLATWGISLMLQQAVRTAFGPTNREVGAPSFMSGAFDLGGLAITYNRLWIIVFAGLVFAALLAILKLTPMGLQMRAVTQNRRMASAMGIRTGRIDALTFGLGSGVAGLAGVALSQIDNVSPNLGQSYIIDSFMVVVFGGVGNLWGTLVGAMTLGVANKLLEPYAGAVLGKIALLVCIILFIQKRPRGLFALKGRAVEA